MLNSIIPPGMITATTGVVAWNTRHHLIMCETNATDVGERREHHDDGDLTFYLQAYHDVESARRCLPSVRRHYPRSRLILLTDGDDDPRFDRLARRHRAELRRGERLYGVEHGGRMVQRMFEVFLEKPSDFLLKIDTDTRVHRRFRYLPGGHAIYGTLEWVTAGCGTTLEFPNVQGGCAVFALEAARRIADSGILLSDELLDYAATYADTRDIIDRARDTGIISTDHVTRWACRRLAIMPVEFEEVRSLYRGTFGKNGDGFAVTHPHKLRRGRTGRVLRRLRLE